MTEDRVEVKKAEIDASKFINRTDVYYSSIGGVKRVHAKGTNLSVVKVELVLNSSTGGDSIVISDREKRFNLEIVPHQSFLERMQGKMVRFFYAELDFRQDRQNIKLLHPADKYYW